ncbi:transposase [Enterococcus faecium]|uniref:transposase n=1 Tax=Enterococcus faecium TaxID=1352 RepID=UPI000C03FF88|nr:transposase [Enterococcus faecium]PHL90110.1 ISL3 family transposase [Enterococcus faecium]
MNDSIKKMLRLIEKDLMITEVSYETFQKKKTLIVDAVFSPAPHTCRNCGSTVVDGNGKVIVVKNGKKETIVRFEQYNHMPLVMRLKKQRYTCKNCRTHWTAQSYFVQPRHSIANHVRYKIASLLTEKVSLSFIAKNCQVSLTTVIRTLKEFKSYLPKQSKRILPRVLMVDEFRSHASIEDKMSFICADGETGQLIDVLPTRKLPRLTSYFLGCYPFLTEAMMIDRLLGFSTSLKEAYPYFHELVEAFRDKDPDLFFSLLAELPETLDDGFREKLQNLLTYEEGITNAMIYPYTNGKIEAKNTHIKTMKRVSYGFKSFENMRIRIFLINQLIKVR